NGGSQAVLDARVLAHELARAPEPAEGLLAYERERRETVNAIVLACRDMPADRILQAVSERAPHGFDSIEDVLTPSELETISGAYRKTSFDDVETLNTRPSYSVSGGARRAAPATWRRRSGPRPRSPWGTRRGWSRTAAAAPRPRRPGRRRRRPRPGRRACAR